LYGTPVSIYLFLQLCIARVESGSGENFPDPQPWQKGKHDLTLNSGGLRFFSLASSWRTAIPSNRCRTALPTETNISMEDVYQRMEEQRIGSV